MNIKLEIISFIAIGIILMLNIVWIISTEKRLKRFFLGKKARDLEDTIIELEKNISNLRKSRQEIEKEIGEINTKLKKSIRGLETIRFNPFPYLG